MLGCVAAVIAIVSPSQLKPAVIPEYQFRGLPEFAGVGLRG